MNTSLDMNFARNILYGILSSSYSIITNSFMNPVELNRQDLKDYSKIIKEPICLNQIKAKMDDSEYQNIKEFICDFRLMLFNCYRYFGCDSKMGKLATKLESMFEQKLILLPIDVRLKTSIDAILMDETQSEIVESGMLRRRCTDRAFSTDIRLVTPIKAMMDELEKFGTISNMFTDNAEFQHDPINFLIERLRKWQDKRQNQQFIRSFDDWFSANASSDDYQVLHTCSEFIQFVQFISAAYQGLGLDIMLEEHLKLAHISFEDLEYALLFPKTSRLLCALVPLITTTSKNRQSALKTGLSDYETWNKDLNERIEFLYKQWNGKRLCDQPNLFVKRYSVDPCIFKVLGNRKPITDKKLMHEWTILQRCHVLLAMCCLTLRLQDTVHFAMDKSIEWESHQVELLAVVGKYEYVRFSGLGEFASYYVYRIEKREIDPELAAYCVQDWVVPDNKRKRKGKPPNKYRMPSWHAAEVKKSKVKKSLTPGRKRGKSRASSKLDLDSPSSSSWDTRSKQSKNTASNTTANESQVTHTESDTIEKSDTTDKSQDDTRNDHNIHSGATSMITNEEDVCVDQEAGDDEEEVPEIQSPKEGEFMLVARDLQGVMSLISETAQKIENGNCSSEELEGYRVLLKNLREIQQFFEVNEASRKERVDQSRLNLRQEIYQSEKKNKISDKFPPQDLASQTLTKDSDSECVSETSSEHYTGSEMMSLTKPNIGRAERLARRHKRKFSDVDSDLLKMPKLDRQTEDIPQSIAENTCPPPQQIKKKVYRICDDYFTEDLEPVQINEDGTLLHLARNLISNDRYELARKMIAMYKLKTNAIMSPSQNGTRPMVSSS